jgi:AcrR family transcriptional regulator
MSKPERRTPQQERSKQRAETILEVAADEIAKEGFDALKMKRIAEISGMSLASLYQYFRNKTDIIKALIEKHYNQLDIMLTDEAANVNSHKELIEFMSNMLDEYLAQYYQNKLLISIWFSTQMSPELNTLDSDRTQNAAKLLAKKWLKLVPNADKSTVNARCLLIMEFTRATGRATANLKNAKQNKKFVEESKRTILGLLKNCP